MEFYSDEHSNAAALLDDLELDQDRLSAMLPRRWCQIEGTPYAVAAFFLEHHGVAVDPRSPPPRLSAAILRATAAGWRPHGFKPLVGTVDREAQHQAVRLGAAQVDQRHLLLGICVLHRQLELLGYRFTKRWRRHNEAGELLAEHGVAIPDLVQRLWGQTLPEASANRSRPWRNRTRADLPFGVSVAAADQRAHAYADAALGHAYAGTSHILMALLSDEQSPASALLREVGVDDRRLAGDVSARLGMRSQ